MAGSKTLSDSQARKLDQVVTSLTRKLGLKDDKAKANLRRFADKYARNKLGIRGTGPHSHGFSKEQRGTIMAAVRDAYNIKAPERKAPVRRQQAAPAKASTRRSSSKGKTTAQLAAEQTRRAAGQRS